MIHFSVETVFCVFHSTPDKLNSLFFAGGSLRQRVALGDPVSGGRLAEGPPAGHLRGGGGGGLCGRADGGDVAVVKTVKRDPILVGR